MLMFEFWRLWAHYELKTLTNKFFRKLMLVGNILFFNYADVIENCFLVWETYKDHATKELMSTFVLFY